jgi:hypothetical protein
MRIAMSSVVVPSIRPVRRPGGDAVPAFRILSLDGRGIMGAFGAAVLAEFEDDCRRLTGLRPRSRSLVEFG